MSENLFFALRRILGKNFLFYSSPDFGHKIGLIWEEQFLILIFVLKFSKVLALPSFQNPAYATARYRCTISSKDVLPGCNDTEMGPANLLHASAYYIEYNERFDVYWAI